MTEETINIIDSTLREGKQTPGVSFTDEHRRKIIEYLRSIGKTLDTEELLGLAETLPEKGNSIEVAPIRDLKDM